MKKKIIVSALVLTIGAGLAGSVTSTVAWYQYSTKAKAAYFGTTGGTSGNLQLRLRQNNQADNVGWTRFIDQAAMSSFLGSKNIVPITSGAMAKDATLPQYFYSNPVYGNTNPLSWKKAVAANYITIPLELRFVEEDSSGEHLLAKDVYLSDLFIAQDAGDTTHMDLSSAIRFHVSAYSEADTNANPIKTNRLVSKNGGTMMACGYLDLDGDGLNDATVSQGDKYHFTSGGTRTEIIYGDVDAKQVSFSAEKDKRNGTYYDDIAGQEKQETVYPMIADINNDNINYDTNASKKIGSTLDETDAGKYLAVDVTIWLEGWQKLAVPNSSEVAAVWDFDSYFGAQFDIGFEFEAKL